MIYPTMEQVESAGREQLARWSRFLPSPGTDSIHCDSQVFGRRLRHETKIMDRIIARFKEMGGMTPEISKKIGWGT